MKKGLEKILNKLDDRDWFQKLLDEACEKEKRPLKAIDYFYASWAGDCPRQIQYSMNGLLHDDIDPQSQRRMDNGNYMHTRFGDYFTFVNRLVAREPPFKKDLDGVLVSGRGDLIVLDDNKEPFLVEMKSINDRGYKNILTQPYDGDYLQWNLCAKALDFNSGIILYENKDSQAVKYHFVSFNQDQYLLVIRDFQKVKECNEKGVIISRPDVCPNPRFCSANKFCKEG